MNTLLERGGGVDAVNVHSPNKAMHFALDRRSFVKLFGGGLLVCMADGVEFAQESGRGGFGGHALPKEVSAWIHIDADGKVTVFTGKIEAGQNIRTSLAQQVADELMTPFETIAMVMGDTDLVPWDAGTFGSQSTPQMGPRLRTMAAAARQTLVEMAAKQWSVDAAGLTAADGKVANPATKKMLTYGEIARGEKLVTVVSSSVTLMPAKDWKIAGTPVAKAQGREFVTGKHQYPSDIAVEGMMFGKVLRPLGYNATLDSIDTSAAEKMPGVKIVRDGDFVGVVAPDMWTAEQALAAIKAKWTVPPQPSNDGIFEYFKANPEQGGGGRGGGRGAGAAEAENAAPQAEIPADAIHLQQAYTVQYIAHAPLEPRAAVAQWKDGKLTVWTGTQRPFGVKDELVAAFHLSPDQVRVIQPDMGAGYGGKHTGDAAVEAARLAKAAGAPVKLVWTRQEEFTWAYFRPAGLMEMKASVAPEGALLAWEHHNYNSGPSGLDMYYEVAARPVTQYHAAKSPLRQGSYRALAATANHFARESFMDELAHAVKMDPLAFRLKNLKNDQIAAVLNAAAERFGWAEAKSTATRGVGIACGTEKGGFVATCAEVAIDTSAKTVKVVRVVQAWESGAVVNPDGLRNQNMGAVMQGLGGALFEAIRFGNGRIENPHFADYRLPRFADMPKIEIVLLDRKDLPPAGAGEIGIVGIAPAVGNAIFAATGARLRNMPMAPSDAVAGIPASPLTA